LKSGSKRTILTNVECSYLSNLIKKKLASAGREEFASINQDEDEKEYYTELFNQALLTLGALTKVLLLKG
jgi:hypothetical protein